MEYWWARPGGSASPVTRNRRYAGAEAEGRSAEQGDMDLGLCRIPVPKGRRLQVGCPEGLSPAFAGGTSLGPEGSRLTPDVRRFRGCGEEESKGFQLPARRIDPRRAHLSIYLSPIYFFNYYLLSNKLS